MTDGRRSDEELAAAAGRGSQEAFRELVERFERPVFALVVRIVRRPELAEELAQEAFVKAWKALGRFDPSRKFSSWLFKIAHNCALDALRRRGEEELSLDAPVTGSDEPAPLPADPTAEDPLSRATARAAGRALGEAMAGLRAEYREILTLRFAEGLSYDEIAEVTGAPLGTVKVHLHRARAEVARRMRELGWNPEEIGR